MTKNHFEPKGETMNEQDGHVMLVARCKALEKIAIDYMTLYMYETATSFCAPEELKARLEKAVEQRAPGCGHIAR